MRVGERNEEWKIEKKKKKRRRRRERVDER